jgi:UDP-N-acetylmuramyl pentapeptide phosphotransferase/UDP-N-acetylglucosamine-1-phosphate transferase
MAVLFFFVFAGSSKSINLTDDVDGHAIGCVISSLIFFLVPAIISGDAILAGRFDLIYFSGVG